MDQDREQLTRVRDIRDRLQPPSNDRAMRFIPTHIYGMMGLLFGLLQIGAGLMTRSLPRYDPAKAVRT